MKQSDFDRLKSVCEKEGFRLESFPGINTIQVFKIDIWEGVEYFTIPSFIGVYKIVLVQDGLVWTKNDCCYSINCCKPSTESAYVEQLKAEAFKRFGEIKEGDRFKREFVPNKDNEVLPVGLNQGMPLIFNYYKDQDALTFGGVGIYMAGKWATRVPEGVKVEYEEHAAVANCDFHAHSFDFFVYRSAPQFDPEKAGDFLASQLEKYLNGEIKD